MSIAGLPNTVSVIVVNSYFKKLKLFYIVICQSIMID